MPIFSVYASFTSDIPKGIVVKPETTLAEFLEKVGFIFFLILNFIYIK